jgi:uncharacterized protein
MPETSTPARRQRAGVDSLPALGVGLLYNPSLPDFLREHPTAYDYVAVIPDMFWSDMGSGARPRFVPLEGWVEILDWLASRKPVVAHNLGFSLGSADLFDEAYAANIAAWQRQYRFCWHSDHLSFVRVRGPFAHEENAGLAVPVPYDYELLELFIERVRQVQQAVDAPFLIENNVSFVVFPEQELSEPEFLNQLSAATGCGLLLDLHNLYTNARNHRFDPYAFLDQLDLAQVGEVHIAGGSELAGMYTDSHAGPCPEPVWQLLEHVVPRAENLAAVTFEFHDSYFPLLGDVGVLEQLARARAIWQDGR